MATYKEIKGVTVQTVDSDPVVNAGSWSAGGTMNTARGSTLGTSTGSSNAFVAGGYTGPPGATSNTESYNGTSWTEVANIPAAYNYGNGFGTNTASIFAGTDPASATTYSWNGSAWSTPGNNMNTGRFIGGTAGTSTAGSIFGGGEPAASTKHEQWDGTSWTETTDLNTASKNCSTGLGIQTAAMSMGNSRNTEIWDGSSWTEVTDLNTPRFTGAGGGTSTLALLSGGQNPPPGYIANTESWNGSSWTELNDLSTARGYIGNSGSGYSTGTTDAIVYGGLSTTGLGVTEEWAFPPVTENKLKEGMIFLSGGTTLKGFGKAAGIPATAWSSGGNLNAAKRAMGAGGRQTSGIVFGGEATNPIATAETYNGSSFTEVADLNLSRRYLVGSGSSSSSAIAFSGQTSTAVTADTETWNGSSWTETADMNSARKNAGSSNFAPATASLIFAGDTSTNGTGNTAITESWNGTSWTEVADLNTARRTVAGAGVQSSAICINGYVTTDQSAVEEWDGSSWTEVAETNTTRRQGAGLGAASSSALFCGGFASGEQTKVEGWNGSSWTEINDLSAARYDLGNIGSSNTGMVAGGQGSSDVNSSEEFTADNALSTVTVS